MLGVLEKIRHARFPAARAFSDAREYANAALSMITVLKGMKSHSSKYMKEDVIPRPLVIAESLLLERGRSLMLLLFTGFRIAVTLFFSFIIELNIFEGKVANILGK